MHDITEPMRRAAVALMQANPVTREGLVEVLGEGNVWSTEELRRDFEVQSFAASFCLVKRRSDGAEGTVMFQPSPRLYFDFTH